MNEITKQHDLSLGKWGPYNKEYLGVCHVANEELGASFGVQLFPAFYRRRIVAASALVDGDVRMFGANAERTAFVYRYELEWKDKVYVDAHFNVTDDKCVHIDCELVNNTDEEQSINIFLAAGMEYPTRGISAVKTGNKKICRYECPQDVTVVDAVDYTDILCAQTLAQDGKFLGETDTEYATGMGTVIGGDKFFAKNHFLKYEVKRKANSLGVRYRASEDTSLTLNLGGEDIELKLSKTENFEVVAVHFEEAEIGSLTVKANGIGVDIDAVIVGYDVERVNFYPYEYIFEPVEKTVFGNSMTLKYNDSDTRYRIEWDREPLMLRTLYTDNVGELLNRTIHDHVHAKRFEGKASEGVYEIVRTTPVYLAPRSREIMSFTVVALNEDGSYSLAKEEKEIYSVKSNKDGKPYEFSHNMMAYNTLLNVVYPIYTRRGYIRHSTPGRIWNCLYTWDSGLIGVGLSAIDYKSAYENLRAYLTPVGDRHSPYVFHGSVVPTQFFLYLELVNKFPEKKEELLSLYPMMMQYYRFFSDMRYGKEQMKSGLLKTWHIFYNSGGWDDYPPQKYVRFSTVGEAETHSAPVTPAITTSIAVLIAKIMKNISRVLGVCENDALFDADIEYYSSAIENNLWDEDAGYYSYLVHDENGNPKEFLRYDDGTNFNMGLDGAYPYIAGISNEHRSAKILDNMKKGMMTKYGLGVVDTRAPYYTPYGYWNGSVWIPHQWIVMKSLLDKSEVDFALEIAKTALAIWKREVDNTYLCFEQFMSENGRGAGFHQFSGLSSPILTFFEMLYKPGSVTAGFQTAVRKKLFADDNKSAKAALVSNCDGASIVICMNSECKYNFTLDGKPVIAQKLSDGAYAIALGKAGEHTVTASKI